MIVDVDEALSGHSTGSAGEIAFAEQLAHTAASLPDVEAVMLYINGAPIDELWGHLDWSQPITPDPFALTPVTIETPMHGATVPAGDVVAEGQATVFEAHFVIRLCDASGSIMEESPVMASTGGPERGTWSFTFTITEPGSYLIEAEEEDASGGEGRAPMLVHREFTVVAP